MDSNIFDKIICSVVKAEFGRSLLAVSFQSKENAYKEGIKSTQVHRG